MTDAPERIAAGTRIDYVDVFAERALEGNALAVLSVDTMPSSALRQAVARETNLAETTFVSLRANPDGSWPVRIHTPGDELPFAGHPVLGTAWIVRERVLASTAVDEQAPIVLATGKGPVPVRFDGRGAGARAWLTSPDVSTAPLDDVPAWCHALSPESEGGLALDSARFAPVLADVGPKFALLAVPDRETLAALAPDAGRLVPLLADVAATGVLLVAPARPGEADLAARMFFDAGGLREDPATGSANACLAAVLRAGGATGVVEVVPGVEMLRPSRLHLRIEADRIEVGGAVFPVHGGTFSD